MAGLSKSTIYFVINLYRFIKDTTFPTSSYDIIVYKVDLKNISK